MGARLRAQREKTEIPIFKMHYRVALLNIHILLAISKFVNSPQEGKDDRVLSRRFKLFTLNLCRVFQGLKTFYIDLTTLIFSPHHYGASLHKY